MFNNQFHFEPLGWCSFGIRGSVRETSCRQTRILATDNRRIEKGDFELIANLLQVKDLGVSYRGADAKLRQAVAGVSFEIARGEVLGLMGESGCGKTSTALALLGLLSDQHAQISGSVQFRGQELLSVDQCTLRALRGAGISMVFQDRKSVV